MGPQEEKQRRLEAVASQQEFPPLKVAKDRPLKVGYLYSNLEAESMYPFLQSDSDRGAAQGMGTYRSIF
ncbi:MAG: hypothetical protein ACLTBV_05650 [Enterocloster bolteae]